MTRPLKFRAWDGKKMISAAEMSEDQLTLDVNGRGFINVSSISTKLSEFYTHMIPMQYTGLKDKNGTEIFEGDIERDVNGNVWMWEWLAPGLVPRMLINKVNVAGLNGEVIGNIYENPDLQTKGA